MPPSAPASDVAGPEPEEAEAEPCFRITDGGVEWSPIEPGAPPDYAAPTHLLLCQAVDAHSHTRGSPALGHRRSHQRIGSTPLLRIGSMPGHREVCHTEVCKTLHAQQLCAVSDAGANMISGSLAGRRSSWRASPLASRCNNTFACEAIAQKIFPLVSVLGQVLRVHSSAAPRERAGGVSWSAPSCGARHHGRMRRVAKPRPAAAWAVRAWRRVVGRRTERHINVS